MAGVRGQTLKGVTMSNAVLKQEYSHQSLSFTLEEQEIIDHALSIIESKLKVSDSNFFNSPKLVSDYLRLQVSPLEREVFGVLFLTNQHQLISDEILFTGTIDSASVYPREVVKAALFKNAAALIFYHNHPSGISEPSQSDRLITRKLTDALSLVDIRVLDHFVLGSSDYVSFGERGWI